MSILGIVRRTFLPLVLLAIAGAASTAFVGCTSLLGSFEVTADVADAAPDVVVADTSTACTPCGNQCVDLTSSTLNCGACGVACLGGQTCQASACKCPMGQASCGGQCVTADRQHCGAACAACPSDQICGATECTLAPAPAFETTPRDPTGWQDTSGAPISFKLKDTGAPNTTYECRTGPDAAFTATVPEWKNCDGAMGKTPVHTPTPDPTTPEGTYRTEYRYRSDTFKSDTATFLFYVHHKLDKVPTCPRPGMVNDGPHFSDDQYFKAAQDYAIANGGPFVLSDVFPVPGDHASDPFVLRGASIRIPFTGVHLVTHANEAPLPDPEWGAFAPGVPFTPAPIVVKSLHHKYVLNATRNLMLVRRQYENPIKHDCKNQMQFGSHKSAEYGPTGLTRGPHYLDCEAFVLDIHGQALCMGKNAAGTAPEPQVIDTHVDIGAGSPSCTLTAAAGSTTFNVNGGVCFSSSYIGYNIEIPAKSGSWYKITNVAGSTLVTVTPTIPTINPASNNPFPGVNNVSYRIGNSPTKSIAIPSGFAQLLYAGHRQGVNPPANRSTKCEVIGCADPTKPWMTYLPP